MFPNPFPLVHVQTVTAPKTVQQSFKECLDRKDVEGAKAIIDELAEKKALSPYAFELYEEAALSDEATGAAILEHLLDGGCNPNLSDESGDTLLAFAAFAGKMSLIEMLLKAGADINRCNSQGMSPLMMACSPTEADMVAIAMDSRSLGELLRSAAHTEGDVAVQRTAIVSYMVQRSAVLDAQDRWGRTPLMYAVEAGDKVLVEALVDHGAKIEARDCAGNTALMAAVSHSRSDLPKRLEIAGVLLAKGADVLAVNHVGMSPLLYVFVEVVHAGAESFRRVYEKREELRRSMRLWAQLTRPVAVYRPADRAPGFVGSPTVIWRWMSRPGFGDSTRVLDESCLSRLDLLLGRGAIADVADKWGITALMRASDAGLTKSVQRLIAADARPWLRDERKHTALDYAIERGNKEVVSALKPVMARDMRRLQRIRFDARIVLKKAAAALRRRWFRR